MAAALTVNLDLPGTVPATPETLRAQPDGVLAIRDRLAAGLYCAIGLEVLGYGYQGNSTLSPLSWCIAVL